MEHKKTGQNKRFAALKCAFPMTVPVMTGYVFIGMSYGILMNVDGFPFWYPIVMAAVIYGGSLEFVTVTMLLSPFAPVTSFVMALMIQARHIFYGIAMLDRYRDMGWKKFFLVFGLSDETFAVNCSAEIPEGIDRGWYYLFVTWLDEASWVLGAALGSLAGSHLPFNTKGVEFVETALFVVIFTDRMMKEKKRATGYIGLAVSALCLALFGADRFMIPALAGICAVIAVFRKRIGTDDPENTEIKEKYRAAGDTKDAPAGKIVFTENAEMEKITGTTAGTENMRETGIAQNSEDRPVKNAERRTEG